MESAKEQIPMENSHNGTTCMKLSKRLAYMLRYGAEKEGLCVREGGKCIFVFYKCFIVHQRFPCTIVKALFE